MDAAAELGRNPVSKHQIQPEYGTSRLTRDVTAEPISRDRILRREQRQRHVNFPCSADHEQDWQPYPVDPYSCYMCDYTYNPLLLGTVNDTKYLAASAMDFAPCMVESAV